MWISGLRISSPVYSGEGRGGGGEGGDGGGSGGGEAGDAGGGAADQQSDGQASDDTRSPGQKLQEAAQTDDKAEDQTSEDATEESEDASEEEVTAFEPKIPEGLEVDDAKLTTFKERVQELELSNEQAQGMLDLYFDSVQSGMEELSEAYANRIDTWGEQTANDKEFGGDKLDENLGIAALALKQFGSDELKNLLDPPSKDNPDGLGLGEHPEVVRFFFNVGKALSEDTLVTTGEQTGEQKPLNLVGALYGREAQEKAEAQANRR